MAARPKNTSKAAPIAAKAAAQAPPLAKPDPRLRRLYAYVDSKKALEEFIRTAENFRACDDMIPLVELVLAKWRADESAMDDEYRFRPPWPEWTFF